MSLEGLIEDMGWQVVGPASSVAEASRIAEEGGFDIALFDVNLNGEKSFPAAEVAAGRGVPVLFATGYDSGLDLPDSLKDASIVAKPFRLDELEDLLREKVGAPKA